MNNLSEIKYLCCVLIIALLYGTTVSQTYFKVKDCSLTYIKKDNAKCDSSGKISTINNISKISFEDSVTIQLNTSKGKSLAVEYKYAKQLIIPGQNNIGKSVGYGALIGFGVLGITGFISGLSGDNYFPPALYGLVGGTLGASIGALIGLLMGVGGNEPDIPGFFGHIDQY